MKTMLFSLIVITAFTFFVTCGEKKEAEMESQQTEEIQAHEAQATEGEMAANMAVDPVCGMQVNKDEAQFTTEYQGKTYYFCMEADKMAFVENPEKYSSEPEQ
ncbi:MAG: YHS domain-containing protein [bacterium]